MYLLGTLKSFRRARGPDMILKGAEVASVKGRLVAGGLPRDCAVSLTKKGLQFKIDGKSPRGLPDWFALIKAVAFVPSDLRMVDGPPDLRREFLDRAAFTLDPTFLGIAREYRVALKQKNALLRDSKRMGRPIDPTMLEIWCEPARKWCTDAPSSSANSPRSSEKFTRASPPPRRVGRSSDIGAAWALRRSQTGFRASRQPWAPRLRLRRHRRRGGAFVSPALTGTIGSFGSVENRCGASEVRARCARRRCR